MVAGQQRQMDAVRVGDAGELVDAVAPVVEAAEQAHEHEARVGDHALGVDIDRIGVLELREAGEAERQRAIARLGRGGDGAEVAVGEGEDYDIAGALPEVDGGVRLLERPALRDQEVHR